MPRYVIKKLMDRKKLLPLSSYSYVVFYLRTSDYERNLHFRAAQQKSPIHFALFTHFRRVYSHMHAKKHLRGKHY